jgi:acyl dehydratase
MPLTTGLGGAPMALFFEDFTLGRTFETGEREITDADITAFADLTGDHNRLHLDEAYARETPFGGRIAHGVLGLAMATGLLSQTGLTSGSLVALVGIEWRFVVPVRPGDRVRLRLTVVEQRPLGDRDRGIVRFAVTLINQRGETVQDGSITELIRRKAANPVGQAEA